MLISVGILTLRERYLLAFSQLRFSRNKVSFIGFLQFFFDGIKLLFNENLLIIIGDIFLFFFTSQFSLFFLFLFYFLYNYYFCYINFIYIFMLIILLIGLIILIFLIVSFFRSSKYSFLGALRFCRGALRLDVVFILILFYLIFFAKRFFIEKSFFLFFYFIFFFVFFLMVLLELNRAPFDFTEGESELVRGFNTELRRFFFVIFFLREYGFLIFYRIITGLLFLNEGLLFCILIFLFFIFIRSLYPRYRYDIIIGLCWFILLPFLGYLFFYLIL